MREVEWADLPDEDEVDVEPCDSCGYDHCLCDELYERWKDDQDQMRWED